MDSEDSAIRPDAPLPEGIERALGAFGQATLQAIQMWLTRRGPGRSRELVVSFPDVGPPSYTLEERVYWGDLIGELFHSPFGWGPDAPLPVPEIDEFGRVLYDEGVYPHPLNMTDANGPIVDPSYRQARWLVLTDLSLLLATYLEEQPSVEYDPVTFRRVFERYRHAWELPAFSQILSMPLIGFSMDADRLPLTDTLAIERFSGRAKTESWKHSEWERAGFRVSDFANARFHITGTIERRRGDTHDQTSALADTIYHVVTALRLLHEGDVTAPYGALYLDPTLPNIGNVSIRSTLRPPYLEPARGGIDYMLAADEADSLRVLIDEVRRLAGRKVSRGLAVPLRRFHLSYGRDDYDDSIIDLMVALESSLLFDIEDRVQLGYRLRLRGAALLREQHDPRKTLDALRELYDLRSKIVHEGATLGDLGTTEGGFFQTRGLSIPDFVAEARQLTREILREYLARATARKSVGATNAELDQIIISSLAPSSS